MAQRNLSLRSLPGCHQDPRVRLTPCLCLLLALIAVVRPPALHLHLLTIHNFPPDTLLAPSDRCQNHQGTQQQDPQYSVRAAQAVKSLTLVPTSATQAALFHSKGARPSWSVFRTGANT